MGSNIECMCQGDVSHWSDYLQHVISLLTVAASGPEIPYRQNSRTTSGWPRAVSGPTEVPGSNAGHRIKPSSVASIDQLSQNFLRSKNY